MIATAETYLTAKGWLREDERRLLHKLATTVESGEVIVNIGVQYGASIHCLAQGSPWAFVIGIDIDTKQFVGQQPAGLILYEGDSSGDVLANYQRYADPISLLFVDGDHSYEGVARDTAWCQFVKPGGYAVFHDCYDYDDPGIIHRVVPGVNQAVSEWFRYSEFEWRELTPVGTCRVFQRT